MNTPPPCPGCGCTQAEGAATHALRAALLDGDLDRALGLGLLGAVACAGCTDACTAAVIAARDGRRGALAARERFRAREARLLRRAQARTAARTPTPADATVPEPVAAPRPALPSAAAAALARAKARAAGGHRP